MPRVPVQKEPSQSTVFICGAGDVGQYIIQILMNNNYNIILIDENEDKIEEARKIADIAVFVGHCCDLNLYKDVDIGEDDVLVAVTSSDEVNLTICNMMKNLGCGTTIARVRHSFYHNHLYSKKNYFNRLGVDVLFNQDDIGSDEIMAIVENPVAIEVMNISDQDDIQIVAYKVKENSILINRRIIGLSDVPNFDDILILGIANTISSGSSGDSENTLEGNLKISLPNKEYKIQLGDILYLSGYKQKLESISSLFNPKVTNQLKKIFILGGSILSNMIAEKLVTKYPRKRIYLIIQDKKQAYHLCDTLNPKIKIFNTDLHDLNILITEGLDKECLYIAASNDEDKNVLTSLFVKEQVAARTITVIQSTTYNKLINYIDIDVTISPRMSIVHYVLQALRGNIYDILSSRTENAEILEFEVKSTSKLLNQMVKNIDFPKDAIMAAVIRTGKIIIPRGSTIMLNNDHIIIFTLGKALSELQKLFG